MRANCLLLSLSGVLQYDQGTLHQIQETTFTMGIKLKGFVNKQISDSNSSLNKSFFSIYLNVILCHETRCN